VRERGGDSERERGRGGELGNTVKFIRVSVPFFPLPSSLFLLPSSFL